MQLTPLSPRTKTIFSVLGSIAVAGALFGGGYFVGTSNNPFGTRASASEVADLTKFWEVWNLIDERFVPLGSADSSAQARIDGAIAGMVEALGDPYTTYFTKEEKEAFETDLSGSFEGVGMEIGKRDGVLTVVVPIKGAPAERAGMKIGDKILKIDGISTADMSIDEAVSKIRGKKGTTVVLSIYRESDSSQKEITITRDTIQSPTLDKELRKDGVYVIKLHTFTQNSPVLFKAALKDFVLAKTDKLIIDLRGNPGGYLNASVDIASWFLPAGKLVVKEDFGAKAEGEEFRSKGYELFNSNIKVVVLVNEGSASASEILAGALQDHDAATIVGVNTFGKGSVQELIDISDDTALKVTIARWLTPDGHSISDGGLTPDVTVEFDEELFIADGFDTQLEKAVEILKAR